MQRICFPTLQQLPEEAPWNRISPPHSSCRALGNTGAVTELGQEALWETGPICHPELTAPLPTALAHLPGELLSREYKSDLTAITGAHTQVTSTLPPCWLSLLGYSLYPHPKVPLPCPGYSPVPTPWCASAIPWVSCQPSPPLQMEMHLKLISCHGDWNRYYTVN